MTAAAARETLSVRCASGGPSLEVSIIATWNRGDIDAPTVGSSGLKEYIRNDIWGLFNADPALDQVLMVRASGPPFLLLNRRGAWFDVTKQQVIREERSTAA